MVNFNVVTPGQTRKRHSRRPNFPIAGTLKPFGLYPLMIHPVLPGETLDNFNMKIRTLSKPVKHPLAGAWQETWLVYVKFTDIDRELGNMFVSDEFSSAAYVADTDDARTFTKSGQIDWVRLCLERIRDAYFVHENETPRSIDGVPQMKLNAGSFYQNMVFRPDEVATDVTSAQDTYENLTGYQMMQQMQMSELTYEKYLKQYGVQSIATGIGEPEILRYSRSWVLPVNTVEPSTGTPSSAWVWSDEIKSDKAKRFDEPGFLVALTGIRPKMYQGNLDASMVGNLWGFSDWYPSYNLTDPTAGIKTISTDDAVFKAAAMQGDPANEILYDHRDLLSHGEQFINTATHPYDLPTSTGLLLGNSATPEDLRGEYVQSTDVDNLFQSTEAADKYCYYEGIASLNIKGHITDTTL